MSTHNIPFSNMKNKKIPEIEALGFFPRDSRTSSKEPCKRAISVRGFTVCGVGKRLC